MKKWLGLFQLLFGLSPAQVLITRVDTTGVVGEFNSIAVGRDGLPVISYVDGGNYDLKFMHCGNASCSEGNTIRVLDSVGTVGDNCVIKIGADGNPVIAYFSYPLADLKVVQCGNPYCSSGNKINVVDSIGTYTSSIMIEIGADGLPIIGYFDGGLNRTVVAKCGNPSCSTGNILSLVDYPNTSFGGSIAIAPDGLPILGYIGFIPSQLTTGESLRGRLLTVKCKNASCSSQYPPVAIEPDSNWTRNFIYMGRNGLPIIFATRSDGFDKSSWAIPCGNSDCSMEHGSTRIGAVGAEINGHGIALGGDGFPVVSYSIDNILRVVKCGNASCSYNNVHSTLDPIPMNGAANSIAIGDDGMPVVSYFDNPHFDLKVAKCSNADCTEANGIKGRKHNSPAWTSRLLIPNNARDVRGRIAPESRLSGFIELYFR